MAGDFGYMKNRIQNELKRDNTDQELADAICDAIAYYRRQRFGFNMGRSTTATVAGVEYYRLPTDFVEADSMVLNLSNYRPRLQERAFTWIDDQEDSDTQTSRPYVYSVQNSELRLYPVPDQSYTLQLSYVKSLPEVSISASDGATNAWMTTGVELIRLHAKVDLLMNIIRGPESMQEAQMLAAREDDVASGLRREYKRSQSSGKLTPSII